MRIQIEIPLSLPRSMHRPQHQNSPPQYFSSGTRGCTFPTPRKCRDSCQFTCAILSWTLHPNRDLSGTSSSPSSTPHASNTHDRSIISRILANWSLAGIAWTLTDILVLQLVARCIAASPVNLDHFYRRMNWRSRPRSNFIAGDLKFNGIARIANSCDASVSIVNGFDLPHFAVPQPHGPHVETFLHMRTFDVLYWYLHPRRHLAAAVANASVHCANISQPNLQHQATINRVLSSMALTACALTGQSLHRLTGLCQSHGVAEKENAIGQCHCGALLRFGDALRVRVRRSHPDGSWHRAESNDDRDLFSHCLHDSRINTTTRMN
jgi:hypothetical protein